MSCTHRPACPGAHRTDAAAARLVVTHPDQGWSLLCNGLVLFEDGGAVLPDRRTRPAHRSHEPLLVAA